MWSHKVFYKKTHPFVWCLQRLTLGILFILLCAGCRSEKQGYERLVFNGLTMGTTYRIVATVDNDSTTSLSLKKLVEKRLEELCQSLSTYIENSEITRFNSSAAGEWFGVSSDLYRVVVAADSISRKTGGAFDITVGQAVDLWGFGAEGGALSNELPEQDKIHSAQQTVDYRQLQIQSDPPALKKSDSELKIDVSAIAKGYGVDEILLLLENVHEVHGAMVEIGGEIRVFGHRSDGFKWTVGIQSPVRDRGGLAAKVYLDNEAVASSGSYVNYFEKDGKRISHVINPLKGAPVETDTIATTVIDESCMTADAWATACMVMDVQKALDIARSEDIGLMIIREESEDSLEVISNNSFKKYLVNEDR
ncbi:MAG TPA: thiamine biosynthesis protein ApbE [Planctomycetaceae bacterium]|nr:thiamine biosynthesis protein ApbE [Planctomycetaceae bacterium]